jgi:hypothetical protein
MTSEKFGDLSESILRNDRGVLRVSCISNRGSDALI